MQHPASSIRHPASGIRHPASGIFFHRSLAWPLTSIPHSRLFRNFSASARMSGLLFDRCVEDNNKQALKYLAGLEIFVKEF
jgi:hypothetical protein